MKKIKRRKFMGNMFCWATALAATGWVSTHADPNPDSEVSEESDDTDDPGDWEIPDDSTEPDTSVPREQPIERIPDTTIQPCYGVAPPPPQSER